MMKAEQAQFVEMVKDFTKAHFAAGKDNVTTFEVEIAVLCALLTTMGPFECTPGHADKVLEAVQSFVLRLRNKNSGAFQLLLLRLSDLHQERVGA